MLAREPKAIILSGGPSVGLRRGCTRHRRRDLHGGRPRLRHVLRLPADGPGPRWRGRPHRRPRVRPHPGHASADVRHAAGRHPRRAHNVWMSHGDSVAGAPEGFTVLASTDDTPVAAFEDVAPRPRRRPVAPRGAALRARPAGARALPARRSPAAARPGRWSTSSRSRSSGSASRSARRPRDLRAVRRRRLRRRRRDRAARDRRPAHLRLRRPRDDAQGRDRAGQARLRGGLRRPRRRRRRRPVPRRARRGPDPEEKRKIIGREFIRTFEAAEVRVFGGLAGGDATAYLVQGTLYPDVVESGGGAGHLQHQVPPQRRRPARRPRSSSWSSRCAPSSRTRCAPSASSSACPRPWCGASPSPAPAWASASSAR